MAIRGRRSAEVVVVVALALAGSVEVARVVAEAGAEANAVEPRDARQAARHLFGRYCTSFYILKIANYILLSKNNSIKMTFICV